MTKNCDICKAAGISSRATVDAKTIDGPWAYMCPAHNILYGTHHPELTTQLKDVDQ